MQRPWWQKQGMLSAEGALAACRMFYGLWAAHLGGLLLAPRMLRGMQLSQRVKKAAGQCQNRLVGAAVGWAAHPVVALCDMAEVPMVWLPQASSPSLLMLGFRPEWLG